MATITHKVIGAGSDENNRIVVSANCDDISVTICWIGRTTLDDECDNLYRDERLCTVVTITPVVPSDNIDQIEGYIEWTPDGVTIPILVYYRILRYCPPSPSLSCETFCDLVELYTTPNKVSEKYEDPIDIHYKYFVTCESGDYVGSRTKNIGVKSVSLSEFNEDGKCYTFKTSEGCEKQVCLGDREDPCAIGTDLYITVSLSKTVIPPNLSDTVYVSVVYKLVETDENCNKITETGILNYPWHIPPCENGCVITGKSKDRELPKTTNGDIIVRTDGEVSFSIGTQKPTRETHPCCFAHTITGSTSIFTIKEDLKTKGKIANVEDIKSVFYNGVKTTKDEISYSVIMNPKKDGECTGVCEHTDKYGVVANTTRVYYETEYMSGKWVSNDESEETLYSVPFYGGNIKVEWDYVRHSVTDDCDEFYTYGTWYEEIPIGGCDERPADCNVCYGHSREDAECDICDAECCYDDIGGKCSLLFKGQLPEFWDDMLMCNNGESMLTIYKCKKCGALTPVMSDDCDKSPKDECPSCGRVETGILEPIEFDMSHEYVESPIYECPICHAKLQSPGIDENCEHIPPDKCPYCGQDWFYDESQKNSGVTSDWYNKVKYAFKQDCNKVCDYQKYETYDHKTVIVECNDISYEGSVTYTSTTEFIGEGCPDNIITEITEPISIEFGENPTTFDRTIRNDKAITIIQKGCEKPKDSCGCAYLNIWDINENQPQYVIEKRIGKEGTDNNPIEIKYELTCEGEYTVGTSLSDDNVTWIHITKDGDEKEGKFIIEVDPNNNNRRGVRVYVGINGSGCNNKYINITQDGDGGSSECSFTLTITHPSGGIFDDCNAGTLTFNYVKEGGSSDCDMLELNLRKN